jgi:hypothetical protein
MRQLNKEQRRFLEYIRDNHRSLGWISRIARILNSDEYSTDETDANSVQCILYNWKSILRHAEPAETLKYGKPTKYLK